MTANSAEKQPAAAGLGIFEKWLSVWVGLSILAGLGLGNIAPDLFASVAAIEYASVNLIIAVLIWAMIYPMMISVDFGSLKTIGSRPKGDRPNAYCELACEAVYHGSTGCRVL